MVLSDHIVEGLRPQPAGEWPSGPKLCFEPVLEQAQQPGPTR